jgi:FMN-dependent NADH-azoreductase
LFELHIGAESDRESFKLQQTLSKQLIEELHTADTLVIGSPLYNFGIAASLKMWIDLVCRAGASFKYTAEGPVGLLNIKRAFIIFGSGGTPMDSPANFGSPHLERVCRFIGVQEVFHIDASGSKGSPELIIANAKKQIDKLLAV